VGGRRHADDRGSAPGGPLRRGTLIGYAGCEDDPWHLAEWPTAWQQAYQAELPPFDPELSEVDHQMGRLPERIRTWPGAKASTGHVMCMVAIGAQADWLTRGQPWDSPAGPGSPLAKLVAADGHVHRRGGLAARGCRWPMRLAGVPASRKEPGTYRCRAPCCL
jgi:hypothetical protein